MLKYLDYELCSDYNIELLDKIKFVDILKVIFHNKLNEVYRLQYIH